MVHISQIYIFLYISNLLDEYQWHYLPTLLRKGGTDHKSDIKWVIIVESDRLTVLSVEEMVSSTPVFGSDGDPTEFYFVQGNHDLPYPNVEHLPRMIQDGKCVNSSIDKIASVNGTISTKIDPYNMSEGKYMRCL